MQDTKTLLLHHIETRLGWVPAAEWTGAHFERLAAEIADATGVHLSVTTLKRVWGHVAYRSQPSATTLDALARFGGFEDWVSAQAALKEVDGEGFVKRRYVPDGLEPEAMPAPSIPKRVTTKHRPRRRLSPALLGLGVAVVLIVLASAMARRFAGPYAGPPPEVVRFEFAPLAQGVPNTVHFRYAIAGGFDSVQIQQSWDARLRHRVDPGRDFYACTYYYPGAYRAKLLADTHVVAVRPLVVPSGGWLGTIGPDDEPSPPLYVAASDMLQADSSYRLKRPAGTAPEHKAAIHYVVASPGLSAADGFRLTSRFRSIGDHPCAWTRLIIFGEQGTIVLPFSLPGCSGELYAYACGTALSGAEVDLSGFGVSPDAPAELAVELRDSVLAVRVGEVLALRQNLSRLPGRIVGARWVWPEGGEVLKFGVE